MQGDYSCISHGIHNSLCNSSQAKCEESTCLGLLSRVSTAAARCRLRAPGMWSRVSSSPALMAHSGHIMIAPCGAFSGLPPIAAATGMGSCATAWRHPDRAFDRQTFCNRHCPLHEVLTTTSAVTKPCRLCKAYREAHCHGAHELHSTHHSCELASRSKETSKVCARLLCTPSG